MGFCSGQLPFTHCGLSWFGWPWAAMRIMIMSVWFIFLGSFIIQIFFWGKGVGLVVLVGPCLGGRSSPIILLSAFSLLQSIVWFTIALIMEGFGDENNEGW